jgi:hypothetical protein
MLRLKGAMMKFLFLLLFAVLAGCASAKQVKGPNGESAYLVKCGNAAKHKCTEKAADHCPQGYNLLERKSDRFDDLTKVGNAGVLEIKADTTKTMLIQCK